VSTNQQRREEAKLKLERELEQRARQDRKRKRLTIAGTVLGAVLVVGGAVGVYLLNQGDDSSDEASETTEPTTAEAVPMPETRATALPATVDCAYSPSGQEPAKPATVPNTAAVSAEGTLAATMETSVGAIGLTLDRSKSPCTVNSFESLAAQGYFNETNCHRMTTEGIFVLQCGDPAGTGGGGPGYLFTNEFPTDQFAEDDPLASGPMNYQRGVVAMANAGPGTNGSQFFLVYGDSTLPPQYTVFGAIDEAGLSAIDAVAAAGANTGGQPSTDGAPNTPVTITSITLPS
jgi:peptidyl-prolyl cis-trans isomerase B (cyclophilin B)